MSTHMGSVNIAIREEAYNFLSSLKTENKSFSDVILEFKKEKDPLDFFGILKDKKDWDETEENMKQFRTSFNKRFQSDRS